MLDYNFNGTITSTTDLEQGRPGSKSNNGYTTMFPSGGVTVSKLD